MITLWTLTSAMHYAMWISALDWISVFKNCTRLYVYCTFQNYGKIKNGNNTLSTCTVVCELKIQVTTATERAKK